MLQSYRVRIALLALCAASLAAPVGASVRTWSGNSGTNQNFSTVGNWDGSNVPLTGDDLSFGLTGHTAPIVNQNYSLSTITFPTSAVAYSFTRTGSATISVTGAAGITQSSASGQSFSVPILLSSGTSQTWTIASGTVTLNSTLDWGTTDFYKDGAGVLKITAAPTGSGATVIRAGSLVVTGAGAIPAHLNVQGGVYVASGQGSSGLIRPLGTTGGRVRWTDSGGFAAFGAQYDISIGGVGTQTNLVWATTARFLSTGSTLILSSPVADSLVSFTNPITLGDSSTASTTRTIHVDDNTLASGDRARITGAITTSGANTYGLTKSGTGNLELSGTNTYNGTTEVLGGTLRVSGTHTGGDNYFVRTGARLEGTGAITPASGKSISIDAGATIGPGDGTTGKFTTGRSFTLANSATSVLEIEINGTVAASDYDQLIVTGSGSTLTIKGARLNIVALGSAIQTGTSGSAGYKIISLTGGATYSQSSGNLFANLNGQANSSTYHSGGLTFTVSYVNNDGVYVNFSSVPEPGMGTLVATMMTSAMRRRRLSR